MVPCITTSLYFFYILVFVFSYLDYSLIFVCLFGFFFIVFFFFSSRRRHTRCALVTGVQTCALPISACRTESDREGLQPWAGSWWPRIAQRRLTARLDGPPRWPTGTARNSMSCRWWCPRTRPPRSTGRRSEERRVGKECVSTCRSRGSP